jgi:hypothetical protein
VAGWCDTIAAIQEHQKALGRAAMIFSKKMAAFCFNNTMLHCASFHFNVDLEWCHTVRYAYNCFRYHNFSGSFPSGSESGKLRWNRLKQQALMADKKFDTAMHWCEDRCSRFH